jgi:hypothetical protein
VRGRLTLPDYDALGRIKGSIGTADDHGFPLTIDFDRPSKPRIESQLSDNHASVAIDHDIIFV